MDDNVVDPSSSVVQMKEVKCTFLSLKCWSGREKSEVIHACTIADSLCIHSLHLTLISRVGLHPFYLSPRLLRIQKLPLNCFYIVFWKIVKRGLS